MQGAVRTNIAVGHARSVEGGGRAALAVEKNEAAGGVGAVGQFADARIGHRLANCRWASRLSMWGQGARIAQQIHSHFGHHDFHDAFAVAGAGNTARFGIRVTSAADQRRIADTSGKFAAGAAGGSAEIGRAHV